MKTITVILLFFGFIYTSNSPHSEPVFRYVSKTDKPKIDKLKNDTTHYYKKIKITIYNAVAKQTDSDPLIMASNHFIDTNIIAKLRYCAISRKLHKKYGGVLRFKDTIHIYSKHIHSDLNGKWVVMDLMRDTTDTKIDLLVDVKMNRKYRTNKLGVFRKI